MSLLFAGESSAAYLKEAELRDRVTNLGQVKRASAHVLQIDSVAREVRQPVDDDQLYQPDGVAGISEALRDY